MTSSFSAESIEIHFLTCEKCWKPYSDPRGLPCQHVFCRGCLEDSVKTNGDRRSLTCPICSKVVERFEEVQYLPVNFFMKGLQDFIEAYEIVKCSNCDANKEAPGEAQVRCMDCKEYLCEKCYTAHRILRITRNHKVVTMDETIPSIPNIRQLLRDAACGKPWECIRQFSIGDFKLLIRMSIDQDDNIVVGNLDKGAKMLGHVMSALNDSSELPATVLPGKKYVIVNNTESQIQIHNSNGKQINTFSITNLDKVPSHVVSIAVDSDDKIIVGQDLNTISIHNTDGSVFSKFETQTKPYRLAVTSNGEIVGTFYDGESKSYTVQLLDYSGAIVRRVIEPPIPDEVKVWRPGFVCGGQGEIFVSNSGRGDPHGVYRFTSEGDYLGCVTTQVDNPAGILLSINRMQLLVVDLGNNHVKLFQRP